KGLLASPGSPILRRYSDIRRWISTLCLRYATQGGECVPGRTSLPVWRMTYLSHPPVYRNHNNLGSIDDISTVCCWTCPDDADPFSRGDILQSASGVEGSL